MKNLISENLFLHFKNNCEKTIESLNKNDFYIRTRKNVKILNFQNIEFILSNSINILNKNNESVNLGNNFLLVEYK